MNTTDSTHKPTLLVVDDTPANLTLMNDLLKDEYKVKVAIGGLRALELARSDKHRPDLILLDIMMPDMDGYAVCTALKQNPQTQAIPIIFLTAKAEPEDEERGLSMGACDYITKPISPSVLLARIKTQLKLKAYADHLEAMVQEHTAALQTAQLALQEMVALGIALSNPRPSASESQPPALLRRIVTAAHTMLACDAVALLIPTPRHTLQLAAHSLIENPTAIEVPLYDAASGAANTDYACVHSALQQEVLLLDDAQQEPRFPAQQMYLGSQGIAEKAASVLCLPLRSPSGALLGVLQMHNQLHNQLQGRTSAHKTFDAQAIQNATLFAELAAAALANLQTR